MHSGYAFAEAKSQCWVTSFFTSSHLIFDIGSVTGPEAPVSARQSGQLTSSIPLSLPCPVLGWVTESHHKEPYIVPEHYVDAGDELGSICLCNRHFIY